MNALARWLPASGLLAAVALGGDRAHLTSTASRFATFLGWLVTCSIVMLVQSKRPANS